MDLFQFSYFIFFCIQLFHDGGRDHIETSPLICTANQWTRFYMITVSVMKELNNLYFFNHQVM